MKHEFERQDGCDECAVCSMPPDTHPTLLAEVPELQTTGPLLPEDTVKFWNVPCPSCGVQSGSCVSPAGLYCRPHLSRLEKARAVA